MQLYQREEDLIHNLKSFIGGGIITDDPCVVIATLPHRQALDEQLVNAGIDVAKMRTLRTYIALDAQETLNEFMVNGIPDDEAFKDYMSGILEMLPPNHGVARAYGEMVAVLWQQHNHAGAIKLEKLWNDLAQYYDFTLFCAYPKHYFQEEIDETRVSLLHSTVLAA